MDKLRVNLMLNENLRKGLIYHRKKNGLTQEQVSKLVDTREEDVWGWEKGLTFPKAVMIYRLSKIYHVTVDQLIEGEYAS